jgi:peroxiredoxin
MRACSIAIVGLLIASCGSRHINDQKGWEVNIKGKVGFPQPGVVTVREFKAEGLGPADTLVVKDNVYEKKLRLTEPGYYQMNFYNQQVINIILGKSNIEVNVDGNNMQGFTEIKGSPEHDLIHEVEAMLTRAQAAPELAEITAAFNEASRAKDEAKVEEIRSRYMLAAKVSTDSVASFLLKQPASIAVVDLLSQGNLLDRDAYAEVYEDAAQKLKKEYPEARVAQDFVNRVEKQKVTSVGKQAPEIALPNPAGDTVRLSSFRGKYVLVDFWAKWCSPCRRENPNVVKAYRKFKDKGFEVFGVSLDRTKEDWQQAIQEDGLVWTHVSDLKYFDSEAARLYNISAIPFSLLLDKKGIIVAKNLRGPALEKKLEEILGK